jgi:hypothetical protein
MAQNIRISIKQGILKIFCLTAATSSVCLLSVGSSLAQTYGLTQTFLTPTPAGDGISGVPLSRIAISGNNVLVGAAGDDTGSIDSGAAYLFNATTGNLLQTFLNPTPAGYEIFGAWLAISGDYAIIGVPYEATGSLGIGNGVAYLFDTATGNLLQTFLNPTAASSGSFGSSLAFSGDNVLINSYLFSVTTGNLLQTFLNPTPGIENYFGSSVAISGDNVLVGTYGDNTGAYDSGAVYLFSATTGNLLQTFLNPTPASLDRFGSSVAISGDNVLVGTLGADTGAENGGVAYLFNAATGDLLQTFLNPTPAEFTLFGSSVDITGDNILIGAIGLYMEAPAIGAAYLFQPISEPKPVPEPEVVAGLAVFGVAGLMRRRKVSSGKA